MSCIQYEISCTTPKTPSLVSNMRYHVLPPKHLQVNSVMRIELKAFNSSITRVITLTIYAQRANKYQGFITPHPSIECNLILQLSRAKRAEKEKKMVLEGLIFASKYNTHFSCSHRSMKLTFIQAFFLISFIQAFIIHQIVCNIIQNFFYCLDS